MNAIERSVPVLQAFQELSAEWARRDTKSHPLLGSPRVQPTIIHGGAFISNVPEGCTIDVNATYLPGDADADGYGAVPRSEIMRAVEAVASRDDWLAEHSPSWTWATDYPPSEIDPDEPIVAVASGAAAGIGVRAELEGIDTTYDGALLTRLADVPSPAFGPGDLTRAHAPDEWVGVDELVLGARAYARTICAWCGVTS